MIRTVLHISWLNLRRDPIALGLTFVLPLAFFSLFAVVFGAVENAGSRPIPAAFLLEDDHALSIRYLESVSGDPGVAIVEPPPDGRKAARELVRGGDAAVVLVIPDGFGSALSDPRAPAVGLRLLADRSNPLTSGVVSGLLQLHALRLGLGALSTTSEMLVGRGTSGEAPVRIETIDVLGGPGKNPSVAYFAAGVGVMFLLFAVSGRSAILLEERESGVLDRMLAARVSLTQLMVGRWLFLSALGAVQVTLMFVWGAIAFGLDLWTPRHLAGFALVTVVTSLTAAAFGLVLSSACRSRTQLNGVAVVVVLTMSMLGGSMFPRFLMPETLQNIGLVAFNAWALTAYQKVFWYEDVPLALAPQIAALLAFCITFLITARVLAARWRRG